MRRQVLQTLLLACCVGSFLSAQAQGPGGHPPGPPQGGHPPGPPPGGGPPFGGNGGNGGGRGGDSNGPGASGGRPTGPNVTSSGGIKLGPAGRWWDDRGYVQSIGIRRDQQKRMDTIFNANKPAIIATYEAYEKKQAALQAITKDPTADKAKVFAAIDAANEAHAALQKANTQMLLQIRQQLDAEQVNKLEKIP